MQMRSLTLLGVLLVALPVGAAESDFKAMFAKHWQVAREFTLAVAEAMPAEGYDFKPNAEEMSFGQLMIHIAAQNSDSCASAAGTKPPPSPPRAIGRPLSSFLATPLLSAPRSLTLCRRSS